MKMIAAVDSNWAIGYKNKLLVSIPADMQFFRTTTSGHVVVMGRKTLESFPNKKPLPKRVNIVLTRDKNYSVDGAVVVHDLDELQAELSKYDSEEIFVIGGETVYRQLEPLCDTAYITKIDYEFQADAYFPNLDNIEGWEMVEESEEQTYFDQEYYFTTYKRK